MHQYKKIVSEEDYNAKKNIKSGNEGQTTKRVSKDIVQTLQEKGERPKLIWRKNYLWLGAMYLHMILHIS